MGKLSSVLFLVLVLFTACSDPSTVGAGLLNDEDLSLAFTDSIAIDVRTIPDDSTRSVDKPVYLLGQLDDPRFGKTNTEVYFTNTIISTQANPNFADATLDSIVLVLPLDTIGRYGDSTAVHNIEVFQLQENITSTFDMFDFGTLLTSDAFEYDEASLLGTRSIVPGYFDSLEVFDPTIDTLVQQLPQIRIPLDNSFGEVFFENDTVVSSDSLFKDAIKGFALRSEPDNGNSMIGLRFNGSLNVYFSRDEEKEVFSFGISNFRHQFFEHEFSNEVLEAFNAENPETLYTSSMAGPNIEFDLSSLREFEDDLINHAMIDIYINEADDDLILYPPIMNFSAFFVSDGEEDFIRDVDPLNTNLAANIINLVTTFQGNLQVDELTGKMKYSMNISGHVVDLLNNFLGDDVNNKIILEPLTKTETPRRAIIHGNDGSAFEPKLKLVITNS